MSSFEELRHYLPDEDTFFLGSPLGNELSRRIGQVIGAQDYTDVVRGIRKINPSRPLVPAILGNLHLEIGQAIFTLEPAKLVDLAQKHLAQKSVEYDPRILQSEDALLGLRQIAVGHVAHYASLGIEDSIELARIAPRHTKPRAREAYANPVTARTVAIVSSSEAFTGQIIPGRPDEPDSVWYNYTKNALETNAQTDPAHTCPALKFTPAVFRMVANVQLAFPLTHPIVE